MPQTSSRRIVLASRPLGLPKISDFRLEVVDLPKPGEGELLLRVDYLSLDPYMRTRMDDAKSYAPPVAIGGVMSGESVATVLTSNNEAYDVGDIVLAPTGWSSHAISNGLTLRGKPLRKLKDDNIPVTTGLGVLGMPGFTAYAGLRMIGKPQPNETVVVAAATGPVGSLVGQLAKKSGARAVGIAGGASKCEFLIKELGFDIAVDHRATDFAAQLAAACSNGIDVYFENVGGAVWQAVQPLLNQFARVPLCGLVAETSQVPESKQGNLAATMRTILSKSITMRGFINFEFTDDHFASFLQEVGKDVTEKKIRYREDIVTGLESTPDAFIGMLRGENFGKLIVRI